MRSVTIAAAILLSVAGCEATYTNHGFSPQLAELDGIEAGRDTRGSVLRKLGRPSTVGSFESENWYYVASKVEHYGPFAPKVVDRKVLAVRFAENGLVSTVNSYGVEDGRVVDLITRTTPTYGRELTVLQQIFGNLGRFSAEDVVN